MTWKDKALNHAKGEDPFESCGLLVVVKGKETYFACKNIAEYQKDMFTIDPVDYS